MNVVKRSAIAVAVLGSVAATAVIAVPSGNAQAPGATTLTFYEPDATSTFKLVDSPPKSPSKNPGSPKYRFSIGDQLTFSSRLYDHKGGTRQGTLYADGTIVKGGSFATAALIATGTYVLADGSQISIQGSFSFSKGSTASIVGGTGRFEAARGHLTSTSNNDSSTDTLTLLP